MLGRSPVAGSSAGIEKRTYAGWIVDYVARHDGNVYGCCQEAAEEMRREFPELVEVRGYVHCSWGKRGHFWLKTPGGEVVDPTRSQFPGPVTYNPWKPGDEVDVGTCMNCGFTIWRSVQDLDKVKTESVCGPECEQELREYYDRETAHG